MNTTYIEIIAPNGETKTYVFHIYKAEDNIVYLDNLEVKNKDTVYTLSPIFDKLINDYTVTVPSDVVDVDIIATASGNNSTVSIDKQPLKSGINIVTITARNNSSENIYTVTIIKDKSSNAYLKNIEVVGYTLEELKNGEKFDPKQNEYTVVVPKSVKKLPLVTSLIITPEDPTTKCIVKGNNTLINNTNQVTITCTSEDLTKNIYYLYVNKELSDNNNLRKIDVLGGSLNETFDKDTLEYTIDVDEFTNQITITGYAEERTSEIKGNGVYSLEKGENIISLIVTSEAGTEKTYTIKVNRKMSDDNTLLKIETNQNSDVIQTDLTHYLINVQYEVKKILITGITNNQN